MHLTAYSEVSSARWSWKIVDTDGNQLACSSTDYPSISEALEAGRIEFRDVVRRHTPVSARRDQTSGRSRGPARS
jgi:hypothetical protein